MECANGERAVSGSKNQRNQYSALKELKGSYSEGSKASDLFKAFSENGLFRGIDDGAVVRQEANDRSRGLIRIGELLEQVDISSGRFLELLLQESPPAGTAAPIDLCTMHGSKGLEWGSVIIMGLNESEYPGEQQKSSDLMLAVNDASGSKEGNELEEERRLFYVAATRTKSNLHLLVPADEDLKHWLKKGWSSAPKKQTIASRFVFEASITDSVVVGKALDNGDRPELKKSMSKLYKWYLQEFDKLAV